MASIESRRPLRIASGLASAGLVALVTAGAITSGHEAFRPAQFASVVIVASFLLIAGLVGWTRRPESRIGPLLVITGCLYASKWLVLSDQAALFTVGFLIGNIYQNVGAHMILTFPGGRASSRVERVLIGTVYALGLIGWVGASMFADPSGSCRSCPSNLALVADAPDLFLWIRVSATLASVVVATAFVVVLVRKWRVASAAARRAMAPVLWVGAMAGAVTTAFFATAFSSGQRLLPSEVYSWPLYWLDQAVNAAVPLGFLAGLLRTRMARSAVGDLVVELGGGSTPEGGLREALARRLGDPSLAIAYFVSERGGYVDERGLPFELPVEGSGRAMTLLERQGEPIAALVHDESVRHDPELIEAVAAAARLALTNERLRAEVRAQLEEVRASRARIVEAGDRERRRVERNIHDGAQQQLVALMVKLRLTDALLERDPAKAHEMLAQMRAEMNDALEDLRDLARGIYPPLLADRGLAAALEAQARKSSLPVTVDADGIDRYAPEVEATVYFCTLEALQNVAKYASASSAAVHLSAEADHLTFTVIDDGEGFEPNTTSPGTGLRGMADRVEALGGALHVRSQPGEGTTVTGRIPARVLGSI